MPDQLISVLAIITEVFYITYMLCKIKDIKKNRLKLMCGITIAFLLSSILVSFNESLYVWLYVVYAALTFFALKMIYKKQIILIDIFIVHFIHISLIFVSFMGAYLSFIDILSYDVAFLITRLGLLFIILSSGNNVHKLYIKYCNLWDRRDDGRIKAITIRNLSLIFINIGLYIISILINKLL